MNEVTRIINAIEQGDPRATEKLLPLVYEELRLLAAQKMAREKPGQTLQATALVHEAYLRLVGEQAQDWKSRTYFFGAAAEAMRRILIDNARRKKRLKRGGQLQRVDIDRVSLGDDPVGPSTDELIALDDALAKLHGEDSTKAEIIKLRYFAGLNVDQTAKVLGVSPKTVKRHWAYARAWLLCEM